MFKMLIMMSMPTIGLGLSAILPAQGPGDPPPPPSEKGKREADDDLRRAYDAIVRLRLGTRRGGPPEERLRDWADRAAEFYRKGLKAKGDGDERLAHEYGAMAHDLARAADHTGNAALFDRRDDDLPPPPGDPPGGDRERAARELRRAHDRIREAEGQDAGPGARFYLDAARDLYRAARRDAEGDHPDRAGELARAAEAMSHVPEHMGHIGRGPDGPPPSDRKAREKGPRPEPRDDLPPPID